MTNTTEDEMFQYKCDLSLLWESYIKYDHIYCVFDYYIKHYKNLRHSYVAPIRDYTEIDFIENEKQLSSKLLDWKEEIFVGVNIKLMILNM